MCLYVVELSKAPGHSEMVNVGGRGREGSIAGQGEESEVGQGEVSEGS